MRSDTQDTKERPQNESAVRGNKIRAIIVYTARTIALMCASGTLMQSFLSELGFESNLIYIHTSLLQASTVITIMLASGWSRKIMPIKLSALTAIPEGILFLLYIPMAISKSASFTAYLLLLSIGIIQHVAVGFFNTLEYKMPYYIYRPDEYGTMLSICGIVSSLISLGIGALISYLTSVYEFISIITVSFAISGALMFIVCITTLFYKNLREGLDDVQESEENEKKRESPAILELLRDPTFYTLIPANLIRGFAGGAVVVLATVVLDLGYGTQFSASMVPVQYAASLTACAIFAFLARRIPSRIVVFVGSVMIALVPLMLIKGNLTLLVYGLVLFGKTLVDYGIPAMLIKIVPVHISGPYHAWRIVLNNGGMLLATTVAAFIPAAWLLSLAAVFQLVSGVCYYVISRKFEKQ